MKQSNRIPDDYQSENLIRDERYELAVKRVKKIKGFYVHLLVYVLVNIFIIAANYFENSSEASFRWSWQTFSTALFWGIGLTAHALSVFGRNLFFSKNWEEKKIKQLIEKEKIEKWE